MRDLDLAVYLVVRTVEATIHEAVAERPDDLASGAIAREVTRLVLGYLTGAPAVSSRARRRTRRPAARTARRRGSAIPSPPRS